MGDAASLFDLAAKISVDAKDSDRVLTATQKKVLELAEEFKKTEKAASQASAGTAKSGLSLNQQLSAVASLQRQRSAAIISQWKEQEQATKQAALAIERDLQGALTTAFPKASALFGAAGPLSLGVVAMGAIAAGAAAAGVALFEFVKSASQSGDHIFDMSKKVNLSVETLSTLSNAAETSGTSLDTLKASLIIFQKNLEQVREGNKGLGIAFRNLNIDTSSTEAALRSAFTRLAQMKEGYNQTAAATRIFGRGAAEVLAIIAETNGNLDEAMARYRNLGTLMGKDGAEAAAKFSDQYKQLSQQLTAVQRTIAEQLMPAFVSMMQTLSTWLSENKEQWASWGRGVLAIITGVIAAQPVQDFLKMLAWLGSGNAAPAPTTAGSGSSDIAKWIGSLGRSKNLGGFRDSAIDLGLQSGKTGAKGSDPAAANERVAALRLQNILADIKAEEDAVERSLKKRLTSYVEYYLTTQVLEDKRSRAVTAGLTVEMEAATQLRDANQRKVQIQTILNKQSEEERRHKEALAKIEDKVLSVTRERVVLGETMVQFATRERVVLTETLRIMTAIRDRIVGGDVLKDLGGGSVIFQGDATRPRIATADEQGIRDKLAVVREQAQQLARDLTQTISSALKTGFEQGIKAGLLTFAQGILQMIESAALKALEKRLTDVFEKILGGGSSGTSAIGTAAKIGIAAIGSLFGGGFSKGGGVSGTLGKAFAGGGTMFPNTWNLVGEKGPELVYSGSQGGSVIPNGGGHTYITNFYVQNGAQLGSRDTQAQVVRQVTRAQQKRALTG